MSLFRTITLCMMSLFFLSGCFFSPKPGKPQDIPKSSKPEDLNRGGSFYSSGINYYEEGEYESAEKNLKLALTLGLANPEDNKNAHKYLAFIYCTSDRQTLCESEFKKVFEIDPNFTLSPAESGHPMWQPVYDRVKSQMAPINKKP
jgi:Tfp pilus assembly protein PilF